MSLSKHQELVVKLIEAELREAGIVVGKDLGCEKKCAVEHVARTVISECEVLAFEPDREDDEEEPLLDQITEYVMGLFT